MRCLMSFIAAATTVIFGYSAISAGECAFGKARVEVSERAQASTRNLPSEKLAVDLCARARPALAGDLPASEISLRRCGAGSSVGISTCFSSFDAAVAFAASRRLTKRLGWQSAPVCEPARAGRFDRPSRPARLAFRESPAGCRGNGASARRGELGGRRGPVKSSSASDRRSLSATSLSAANRGVVQLDSNAASRPLRAAGKKAVGWTGCGSTSSPRSHAPSQGCQRAARDCRSASGRSSTTRTRGLS
jgi:hypothetical protein